MSGISWSLWICALFLSAVAGPSAVGVNDFQARSYKNAAGKALPYRLFVPKNYQATKKYPLMLALHGGGERGTDNVSQLHWGFTTMWAEDSLQKDNPCFLLAPQCPAGSEYWVVSATFGNYDLDKTPITWELQSVLDIMDSLAKEFPIDADRVYVSGMSRGGAGTWYLVSKFPERFAAAIPVAGGGDPKKAPLLTKLPIWAFHEADDPTVPVHYTRDLVDAIHAAGGTRIKYTEYPASLGLGHESWIAAGNTPELPKWLFQQSRAAATVISAQAPDRFKNGKEAFLDPSLPVLGLAADAMGRMRINNDHVYWLKTVPSNRVP